MEPNIKKSVNQFLSDRKYSNNLIEILSSLEPDKVKPNIILEIQRLFTEILKKGTMFIDPMNENTKSSAIELKYTIWLRNCYKQFLSKLVNVLSNGETDSQLQALLSFMYLVQVERKNHINQSQHFPEEKLTLLLKHIIISPFCSIFTKVFKQYFTFIDIIFYTYKSISYLISNDNFLLKQDLIMNTINFLKEIPLPSNREKLFSVTGTEDFLFCGNQNKKIELKDFCSYATKIWNALTSYKNHNNVTMKEVVILLIDKLMHYHSNPILITDFLMNALKFDGPIAVLSLQGMVNLVRQYNLEYPNIYDKLYNLLEPNIFYTKYKARLFYLTDLLMMSTHLPEALVASFIKRLSRLCLTAPPQDIAIMIYLIGNLILRHKGLVNLYESVDNTTILENDPFDENEVNPYNTNALKSSLWEIKILQNHPLYTVNVPARFINNPLPRVEWDVGKYLEVTYDEIFTKENKKKQKNISTNFEKPNSMFQPNTNEIFDQFSLV